MKGSERPLRVCACLPRRFLPWRAARGEAPEAQFGSAEYNAITWVKVLAVAHLVERCYVVHLSGELDHP